MDGVVVDEVFGTPQAVAGEITPVLLSGGSGSRLWPMSREQYPKQFLSLCSNRTMLQETALRVAGRDLFRPPLVVCNEEHRFVVAEQMRLAGTEPGAILLEPTGRDTAAACAIAALHASETDPNALLLVLPVDHHIRSIPAFVEAVERGAAAAANGRIVTFGVHPSAPAAGYGCIRHGDNIPEHPDVHLVAEFTEKPARHLAEDLVADGCWLRSSGMFLFQAATVLAEFERHAPEVLESCRRAFATRRSDMEFVRMDAAAYGAIPCLSFDHAVMERTSRAAVIPCDPGWTDVGNWSALWEVGAKDAAGNVRVGDAVIENARNCYVRSDGRLTAAVGVDDTIVVVSEDAVLVVGKDKAQDVKALVDRLKKSGRREIVSPLVSHRPWGSFQTIYGGDRFQVKCLVVQPGGCLSLQRHYHRAEHWIVVRGTALVVRGDEKVMLYENQSIDIPMGAVHRLENPGKVPLSVIEVQCGGYLGEDDIVRLEDFYGRAPHAE